MQPAHELDVELFEPMGGSEALYRAERRVLRVSSGLNEVKTRVHAVINNLLAVDAVLLLEVRVEPRLDVFDDRPPARPTVRGDRAVFKGTHLSSLFTKSPNPGVSTTVRCRRTPFSSMSMRGKVSASQMATGKYRVPAPMLSMATVLGRSAAGGRGSLGG